MTAWQCVPCPNPDCRRDTFLARKDPDGTVAEIYCAACKIVIARFESEQQRHQQDYVMAPGGLGP